MSSKPRDDILGVLRKHKVFTFNQYSPSQRRDFLEPIKFLEEKGMITVDKCKRGRWICTPGPNWQRRPKWEKLDGRAEG